MGKNIGSVAIKVDARLKPTVVAAPLPGDTWRQKHRRYLRSPEWRARRKRALDRAGHRCERCTSRKRLQVHHRTYERLGHELPGDLMVLCDRCHVVVTERQQGRLYVPLREEFALDAELDARMERDR